MAQYLVFADTNVFLDALLHRNESKKCKQILDWAEKGIIEFYTSSSCLLNVIYFLQKAGIPEKVVRETLEDLLGVLLLKSTDIKAFQTALPSTFSDLEDAVQYQTALQIKGIDFFITSNTKDFKNASDKLPVITPKQFVDTIQRP